MSITDINFKRRWMLEIHARLKVIRTRLYVSHYEVNSERRLLTMNTNFVYRLSRETAPSDDFCNCQCSFPNWRRTLTGRQHLCSELRAQSSELRAQSSELRAQSSELGAAISQSRFVLKLSLT